MEKLPVTSPNGEIEIIRYTDKSGVLRGTSKNPKATVAYKEQIKNELKAGWNRNLTNLDGTPLQGWVIAKTNMEKAITFVSQIGQSSSNNNNLSASAAASSTTQNIIDSTSHQNLQNDNSPLRSNSIASCLSSSSSYASPTNNNSSSASSQYHSSPESMFGKKSVENKNNNNENDMVQHPFAHLMTRHSVDLSNDAIRLLMAQDVNTVESLLGLRESDFEKMTPLTVGMKNQILKLISLEKLHQTKMRHRWIVDALQEQEQPPSSSTLQNILSICDQQQINSPEILAGMNDSEIEKLPGLLVGSSRVLKELAARLKLQAQFRGSRGSYSNNKDDNDNNDDDAESADGASDFVHQHSAPMKGLWKPDGDQKSIAESTAESWS